MKFRSCVFSVSRPVNGIARAENGSQETAGSVSGTIRIGSPIASGRRGVSKSDLARSSAAAFQASNMSFVKRGSSLSTSFPQDWQHQIALPIPDRCAGLRSGSKRGPPGAAAVICAATPKLMASCSVEAGPLVSRRQSGFEQRFPALLARDRTTEALKSSRCRTLVNCS